ncbi:MAG: hypothetical protein FVQ81_07145 [Candidatus Glassbacteria bacterium]|nr:hypothetical protein [Candidatus Glassbacteria bacterium]
MKKIAGQLAIPDYEKLLDATASYCRRLLPAGEYVPPVPGEVAVCLPELRGIRLVLWDIYGTLFATRAGDLEGSLSAPEAMLGAFGLTADEFGFTAAFGSRDEAALWLRDCYLELIETEREEKKKNQFPFPEVRIEHVWRSILGRLDSRGWRRDSSNDRLLPYLVSLFYEISFQQAIIYTAAWPALTSIKRQGLLQGIVSNAQFYTPLLLDHFLRSQSGGQCSSPWEIFDPGLSAFSYLPGLSKPDPRIFQPVLDQAAVRGIAAAEILYVGNDKFNDVHCASQLGLRTALFAADSSSLKLHRDNEAADRAEPDAVVTDFCQLPFILGRSGNRSDQVLKMAVWHYHFRPGGVTSVVRDTLLSIGGSAGWKRCEITLLASEAESGGWPGWIAKLNEIPGLSVRAVDIPGLAYDDQDCENTADYERRAANLCEELIRCLDLDGCTRENPFVLHVHNAELGKNPVAAGSIRLLAHRALEEELPLVVLNQTHDFAELHRPDRVRAWRNATCLEASESLVRWVLPAARNMVHAALTGLDRDRLISTGLESRSAFVLPNPVTDGPAVRSARCEVLEKALGGRPYLLAAQKVMRRKNTLELLLVTAAVRAGGFDTGLVITLPAASEADRQYEQLVLKAADMLALPALIGLERSLGDKAPEFGRVLAGASALVTASVMEGFGMGFLEGWVAGRPVLGRWIDGPCDDFTEAGVDLSHLYRTLLVDPAWIEGGISRLMDAYRGYTESLRDQLGFPSLQRQEFENAFRRHKIHEISGRGNYVDFGDLSADMQCEILERIAGGPTGDTLKALLELNPSLLTWRKAVTKADNLVDRNRQAVLDNYDLALTARRLASVITAAAAQLNDPGAGSRVPEHSDRSLAPLLEETVSLHDTRLLYS